MELGRGGQSPARPYALLPKPRPRAPRSSCPSVGSRRAATPRSSSPPAASRAAAGGSRSARRARPMRPSRAAAGARAEAAVAHRYVLLNKPTGTVSTARDERGRPTVVSLVGARERLYPVGRLDSDSEGLLLLTNDGAWAERVLHPRFGHEREYEVEVQPEPTAEQLAALRPGVPPEGGIGKLYG